MSVQYDISAMLVNCIKMQLKKMKDNNEKSDLKANHKPEPSAVSLLNHDVNKHCPAPRSTREDNKDDFPGFSLCDSAMPKTCKWSDEYFTHDFIALLEDRRGQEHQAKHSTAEYEQTPKTLQAKRAKYDQKGTLPRLVFKPVQKPLLQASYEVEYQCIRIKALHSAPENLIKPCTIQMVELVLGTEAAKKLKDVPLSNDVIAEMSRNILDQTVQEVKESSVCISLQLDKSTDVSNMNQLIVYTWYIKDGEIKDEFLFCEALQTMTKAADISQLMDEFFEKHQIKWEKVVSVCTDGAPAMIGYRSRLF
ncbi:protein FAM200C-like [Oratosquilla oratoria]|uniref:protein FAM200C-like n=1 Tax=Oratosquilla oratoria TaxID=337810 RepID=UPI003F772376